MKALKRLSILAIVMSMQIAGFAQDLTWEQQQRLQQYFDTNSKLFSVSKNILDEVLKEHKDFFGHYSDALVAVDILNKVANAQDWPALESTLLFTEGKVLEIMYPNFAKALSWASWAKTGMELLKQFVVDPALMSEAKGYYYNNREKLQFEPNDAVTSIRSWGNIEQQLMAEFRTQFGDQVFKEIKPSGLVLLPKWQPGFDRFVVSWFENEYQKQKFLEFQKESMQKLLAMKNEMNEQSRLIEYWIDQKMKEIDYLTITPDEAELNIGQSVTFVVTATDLNGKSFEITNDALTQPTFIAVNKGEFTVTANYLGATASAKVRVNLPPDCTAPNEEWDETLKQCVCKTGFERNDQGICVAVQDTIIADIVCTDPNSEKVWDQNLNKFVCNCKENYIIDPTTGLCVADLSELLMNADCANVDDAVAEWDPISKQVICSCTKNYYRWDSGQKKCMPDVQAILNNSDCSQYPNTRAIWDYSLNEPVCECLPDYVWNKENTGCVEGKSLLLSNADCSGYLNTRPVWDENSGQVVCDCLPGYKWNKENTACQEEWIDALQNADCSGYLNTQAVWDPVSKEVYCDCQPGYKWSDDNTHCEEENSNAVQSNVCWQYPNTQAVLDPVSGQYVCDCLPGYRWNRKGTGCVPEQNKPDIDFGHLITTITSMIDAANYGNSVNGGFPDSSGGTGGGAGTSGLAPVQRQSNCNDKQQSGGDAPEVHTIDLGQSFGTFLFDFDTYDVKDQIIVSNGGTVIFDSGCVGQRKSVQLNLNGYSSIVTVSVNPNCDGTNSTGWNFTVHCPD